MYPPPPRRAGRVASGHRVRRGCGTPPPVAPDAREATRCEQEKICTRGGVVAPPSVPRRGMDAEVNGPSLLLPPPHLSVARQACVLTSLACEAARVGTRDQISRGRDEERGGVGGGGEGREWQVARRGGPPRRPARDQPRGNAIEILDARRGEGERSEPEQANAEGAVELA